MCIRDSAILGTESHDGALDIRQVFQVDLHAEISARDHNACLLYTSDAADDLLCVDLGGRRIIKKKIITYEPVVLVTIHLIRYTVDSQCINHPKM